MSKREAIYLAAEDVHLATLEHLRRVLEYAASQPGSHSEAIHELIKTLRKYYQTSEKHAAYLPWVRNGKEG